MIFSNCKEVKQQIAMYVHVWLWKVIAQKIWILKILEGNKWIGNILLAKSFLYKSCYTFVQLPNYSNCLTYVSSNTHIELCIYSMEHCHRNDMITIFKGCNDQIDRYSSIGRLSYYCPTWLNWSLGKLINNSVICDLWMTFSGLHSLSATGKIHDTNLLTPECQWQVFSTVLSVFSFITCAWFMCVHS